MNLYKLHYSGNIPDPMAFGYSYRERTVYIAGDKSDDIYMKINSILAEDNGQAIFHSLEYIGNVELISSD